MRLIRFAPAVAALLVASCGQPAQDKAKPIEVRSAEQERLHTLGAFDLAIALKRAVQDLGYTCARVEQAGFVGKYENLDMWMAKCGDGREWAIFSGPDGSAQARDCADLAGSGVPECKISSMPEGSFTEPGK